LSAIIEVYQKNDRVLEVTVKDEDGAIVDLTGASLTFTVASGSTVKFTKTSQSGGGITIADAAAGVAEIEITNVDTNIDSGWYQYELLFVNAAGQRYTADAGRFGIIQTITAN
jgi:hypothetical protein